jgi:hypothetical protein
VIKGGGEDELAYRTAVVVDGNARELENLAPVNLAILVKIHNPVKASLGTTALARGLPGPNGVQLGGDLGSPVFAGLEALTLGHLP